MNKYDIKEIQKKSKEERILDFIINTKNPYVFGVNGRLVKIEFSNNNRNTKDAIMNVIKDMYRRRRNNNAKIYESNVRN